MAVTSSNIPSAEKVPATKSTLWQEEMRGKDQADGGSGISPTQSPVQGQAGAASSLKDPALDSKEGEGWGCQRWCDTVVTWFRQLSQQKNTVQGKVFHGFSSRSIPARSGRQTWSLLCRDRSEALRAESSGRKKFASHAGKSQRGAQSCPGRETKLPALASGVALMLGPK